MRVLIRTAFAATVLLLGACQTEDPDAKAGAPSTTTAAATTIATTTAPAPASPTSAPAAGFPDVCTLLSRAEVTQLTGGKPILSVDPDGLTTSADVRHCQWQLSGARIAVQLSRTTAATFGADHPGSETVADLGDGAHYFSNHLFVRKGTVQVDVYASTAEGVANDKRVAQAAAAMVVARL
jgi:hypothetical protein